jgi:hypothetical protein
MPKMCIKQYPCAMDIKSFGILRNLILVNHPITTLSDMKQKIKL